MDLDMGCDLRIIEVDSRGEGAERLAQFDLQVLRAEGAALAIPDVASADGEALAAHGVPEDLVSGRYDRLQRGSRPSEHRGEGLQAEDPLQHGDRARARDLDEDPVVVALDLPLVALGGEGVLDVAQESRHELTAGGSGLRRELAGEPQQDQMGLGLRTLHGEKVAWCAKPEGPGALLLDLRSASPRCTRLRRLQCLRHPGPIAPGLVSH
jgi:hypothetical protein